jgi:polar amino acid transport system substrate-binding protein
VGSARSAFPRAILREFTSFDDMVAAASRGEILGALDNDLRLRRYLRLHPGEALRLDLEVLRDLHDPIAIAVRPDSPHLLDWINTYLLTRAPALSPQALLDKFDR